MMALDRFVKPLVDVLFPSLCAVCRTARGDLCADCSASIACSAPLRRPPSGVDAGMVALGAYDGALRRAILALKFRGARNIGVRLGELLAVHACEPYDAIVPVPLHAMRRRERGYNQAEEIARGIARVRSANLCVRALVRVRRTQAQSALDLEERRRNVAGAFAAGPGIAAVSRSNVLLVDDVFTTGATARACAAALRRAGAREIYLAIGAVRL